MRVYECFADDCPFRADTRRDYASHLFEIHTDPDRHGTDRHETVLRIMNSQGYFERPVPRETGLPVPGGMRRTYADYGTGDVW